MQSFDFPTAYIKKNQVANRQIEKGNYQEAAYRQDMNLESDYYQVLAELNKYKL